MYSDLLLETWLREQIPRSPSVRHEPAFFRRIEQSLDIARKDNGLMTVKPRWDNSVIDLTTSDFLSLNRMGKIRQGFNDELVAAGEFILSASGSRVQYGNYNYLLETERQIAAFHKSETAWIAHSGLLANMGVLEAICLPGDTIVYDELSHASTMLGMKLSRAASKTPFKHNSIEALRDVLEGLKGSEKGFVTGEQSILICVESIYSMEGDICPLEEFVMLVKEMFPAGNAQFLIDEAHSSGVLGPNGAGLVQQLGLEKEVAIRVHVCSKALASTGGVVLCNKTVRNALIHHSRALTYSGAPSFPMVASIRAGYNLLISGATREAQQAIQTIVKYFLNSIAADEVCQIAMDEGLLVIPLVDDWEQRAVHSHIVPIKTRPRHEQYLAFDLALANMNAYSISYPVVPKGGSRVRLVFHAHNTEAEIDQLIAAISNWAKEMMDIDAGKTDQVLPSAARQVFSLQSSLLREVKTQSSL